MNLWRDLLLFYEYFHGDNGAGLGASHQTGWTGIIARTKHLFATTTGVQALELGKAAALLKYSGRSLSGGMEVNAASCHLSAAPIRLNARMCIVCQARAPVSFCRAKPGDDIA